MKDQSLVLLSIVPFFMACGSKDKSGDDVVNGTSRFISGYPVSHDIASEQSCTAAISPRNNSSLYAALGLSSASSVFYQVLSNGAGIKTVHSSISSPSETYQSGRQYGTPMAASGISVLFDVVGSANGGRWDFTQDAKGNITFTYTDSDMSGTPDGGYCQSGLAVTASAASEQLTSTYTAATGLSNGQAVRVSAVSLPGGLAFATTYYVMVDDAKTLRLSATAANPQAIDLTSDGDGVVIYRWYE